MTLSLVLLKLTCCLFSHCFLLISIKTNTKYAKCPHLNRGSCCGLFVIAENIALNKPAVISAADPNYAWSSADKAVDGDDTNDFYSQHCSVSRTDSNSRQWWQVDLERTVWITAVVITYRGDSEYNDQFIIYMALQLHDEAERKQDDVMRRQIQNITYHKSYL